MPIEARRKRSSEANRARALLIFERESGGAEVCAEDLPDVFARLEKVYKPSYVEQIFRACRNEYPWFPKDIRYSYSKATVQQETVTEDEVRALVKASLSDSFRQRNREATANLFLATIYGLRREEMHRMTLADFDAKARTLFVRTAKGGVERKHLVPEVGIGILEEGLGDSGVSKRGLTVDFHRIEAAAGLERKSGRGWHSIRRSLATRFFEMGVDPIQVKKFLRWSEGSMYEHYVCVEYSTADRCILERHPFLGFWQ